MSNDVDKYLKYKQKYLTLKNQISNMTGGMSEFEILSNFIKFLPVPTVETLLDIQQDLQLSIHDEIHMDFLIPYINNNLDRLIRLHPGQGRIRDDEEKMERERIKTKFVQKLINLNKEEQIEIIQQLRYKCSTLLRLTPSYDEYEFFLYAKNILDGIDNPSDANQAIFKYNILARINGLPEEKKPSSRRRVMQPAAVYPHLPPNPLDAVPAVLGANRRPCIKGFGWCQGPGGEYTCGDCAYLEK
jgi:hypothetical protein